MESREMFEGEKGREPPEPTMDSLDNRNMVILAEKVRAHDMGGTSPRRWPIATLRPILDAMRQAGDEALLGQVTVRLERSFGSTHDVRAGAVLVTNGSHHLSDKPEVIEGCGCAICKVHHEAMIRMSEALDEARKSIQTS